MEKESLFKRYCIFIAGLYFLAMGVVLIVRSNLGTTPISSLNYVISINSPLSLGVCTFIVNLIMIAIQLWLVKGKYGTRKDRIEILLQIPLSFVFSAFIDFNMMISKDIIPDSYQMQLLILLTGCIIQAAGVVLEIKTKVAMMSAEGVVKYISKRVNKEFGIIKVYVDVLQVILAAVLSFILSQKIEGIREGTVIAALITGYIVKFMGQYIITKKTLYMLIPVFKSDK